MLEVTDLMAGIGHIVSNSLGGSKQQMLVRGLLFPGHGQLRLLVAGQVKLVSSGLGGRRQFVGLADVTHAVFAAVVERVAGHVLPSALAAGGYSAAVEFALVRNPSPGKMMVVESRNT